MQDLECRQPSIAFDDCEFFSLIRWENNQRLVLEEAVIEVGLRQLLQHALLAKKIQELGLGCSMKPLGKPRVFAVKQEAADGNVLYSRWP